jgi:hypothetical protein
VRYRRLVTLAAAVTASHWFTAWTRRTVEVNTGTATAPVRVSGPVLKARWRREGHGYSARQLAFAPGYNTRKTKDDARFDLWLQRNAQVHR